MPPLLNAVPLSTPGVLPASTGNGALDAYTQAGLSALQNSPNAPGPNGGLSPSLLAQYQSAQPLIQAQTSASKAQAISGAQGNGLGGSSIAAQGVENAETQGTMADTSLLSSMYGEQNTNNNANLQDLLSIYDSAGTSAANMQMYSQGLQEALQQAASANQATEQAGKSAMYGQIASGILGAVGKGMAAS